MGFRVPKTATMVNVKIIMRSEWLEDEESSDWEKREQFMAFAEFIDNNGDVVEEWRGSADKIATPAQIDKLRTILTWLRNEAEKEL